MFHDGFEALTQNHIQERKLEAVNDLLPVFKAGEYTQPEDHAIVRGLLKAMLRQGLPSKREHNPYVRESSGTPWTDEELENAFETELKWTALNTISAKPAKVDVASTVKEGNVQRFRVTVRSETEMLSQLSPYYELTKALADTFKADDYLRFDTNDVPGSTSIDEDRDKNDP